MILEIVKPCSKAKQVAAKLMETSNSWYLRLVYMNISSTKVRRTLVTVRWALIYKQVKPLRVQVTTNKQLATKWKLIKNTSINLTKRKHKLKHSAASLKLGKSTLPRAKQGTKLAFTRN